MMKQINESDTQILLSILDKEITLKCIEIKEKREEAKLKKILFSGCVLIPLLFIIQVIFKLFNLNFIIIFFIYQSLALILIMPLIIRQNKGELYK